MAYGYPLGQLHNPKTVRNGCTDLFPTSSYEHTEPYQGLAYSMQGLLLPVFCFVIRHGEIDHHIIGACTLGGTL